MFELKKIRNGIYHISFDTNKDLALSFFRYQEYYESPFEKIHNKNFTLIEHINEYVKNYQTEKGLWTYWNDWGGFNIPAHIIKEVHDNGIKDYNHYDSLMDGIYGLAMGDAKSSRAYLIGTSKTFTSGIKNYSETKYLKHELTHAMFYLNEEYSNNVKIILGEATANYSNSLWKFLYKALRDSYADNVIEDEINAYITTGEGEYFKKLPKKLTKQMNLLRKKLKALHKKEFNKWLNS